MRARLLVLFVLAATSALSGQTPAPQTPAPPAAAPQPPPPQRPTFRAGVDILTVDATVVDREGKQITDLRPEEFVVEVDGDPRPVVTAEYVKLTDDTPVPIGAPKPGPPKPSPDEAFFSTNARAVSAGRLIVLIVDQGNIRVGQGRQMMRSAVKFVDQLSPNDRVAMIAIPRGQLVDFTTNHERVREALLATVGLASPFKGRFHISLSEAIATVERSDATLRAQLMMRECGDILSSPADVARCEIEVEQECSEVVSHQRMQTQDSLRAMREILKSIGAIDGPKAVIVVSEGLVMEGLSNDVDEIAAVAADSRASLDVMLLDVPSVDVTESQRPSTPREDRDKQVAGLESLAGLSRGQLHRIIVSGDTAFVKVLRSISGYYLLGVESRPKDRDGKRHRIHVKSNRRSVTVLSRRGFLAPTSPGATTANDAVAKALRAPLTINELPMKMTTWTYKEPGGSRNKVMLTAEIERTADQSLDYTAGLAVIDRNNKTVVNSVEAKKLDASDVDPGPRRLLRHHRRRAGNLPAAIRRRRQRGQDRVDRAQGGRVADEQHRPDRRRSGDCAGAVRREGHHRAVHRAASRQRPAGGRHGDLLADAGGHGGAQGIARRRDIRDGAPARFVADADFAGERAGSGPAPGESQHQCAAAGAVSRTRDDLPEWQAARAHLSALPRRPGRREHRDRGRRRPFDAFAAAGGAPRLDAGEPADLRSQGVPGPERTERGVRRRGEGPAHSQGRAGLGQGRQARTRRARSARSGRSADGRIHPRGRFLLAGTERARDAAVPGGDAAGADVRADASLSRRRTGAEQQASRSGRPAAERRLWAR